METSSGADSRQGSSRVAHRSSMDEKLEAVKAALTMLAEALLDTEVRHRADRFCESAGD